MADPLILLAPPRSFTSVVCAMVGQHPEMYSVPELNMFVSETMRERENILQKTGTGVAGLLRTVAQLFGGEQTVQTVMLAKRWVQFRMDSACVSVMRELMAQAAPRAMVQKSPREVRKVEYMQRMRRAFPNAKYLHLLRHPRPQGHSLLDLYGPLVGKLGALDFSTSPPTRDPQRLWFSDHSNICAFLESVPKEQKLRIRGEDLLENPEEHMRQIAEWLGVRTDDAAIKEMLHPERSDFAGLGPINARLGNDPKFLKEPALRAPSKKQKKPSLDGPLGWRKDGKGFSPEVIQMAMEFGYN